MHPDFNIYLQATVRMDLCAKWGGPHRWWSSFCLPPKKNKNGSPTKTSPSPEMTKTCVCVCLFQGNPLWLALKETKWRPTGVGVPPHVEAGRKKHGWGSF